MCDGKIGRELTINSALGKATERMGQSQVAATPNALLRASPGPLQWMWETRQG